MEGTNMTRKAIYTKKLYDGTKAPGQEQMVVIVEGEKIIDILPASAQERIGLYQAEKVDGSDKYMIPGMIDVHTHLMMEGKGPLAEYTLKDLSLGEVHLLGLQNALKALRAGVTTLRDTGSIGGVSRSVKNFINKGRILGPDVLICGMPVTSTGGHCNYMGGEADGVDAIRHLIRQQQKDGIDFVKVMATAGGTIGVARGNTFQADEYQACVDEAHRLGLKITMHCCTYDGCVAVADTGLDGLEHCMFYNDNEPSRPDVALAEKYARNQVQMDHTLSALGATLVMLDQKPKEEWTDFDRSEYKRISLGQEKLYDSMRFQYEHGCQLVAGSDSGWKHCDFSIGMGVTLMLMGQNGIPLDEVLVAATSRPAKYLGVDDKVGVIKKGMQADLVLLDQDPMVTPEAYRHVNKVFKRGILVDNLIV